MERKIFNSDNSRIKFPFDESESCSWWIRSAYRWTYVAATAFKKPHAAIVEYRDICAIGYINSVNSISYNYPGYNYPGYSYYITPVCTI